MHSAHVHKIEQVTSTKDMRLFFALTPHSQASTRQRTTTKYQKKKMIENTKTQKCFDDNKIDGIENK